MKQTHKSLKEQVISIRKAVSDMFIKKDESILLDQMILYGREVEQNYLLSRFDRYGVFMEYEKTGIRVTGDGIKAYAFGYPNRESIEAREDSVPYVLAEKNIGVVKERELIQSFITYPKMDYLIDALKVVNCMHNFKVSLSDAIIYNKIRKAKHIISKIREKGLKEKETKELSDIFYGMNDDRIDKVLECFDSTSDSFFKGIRVDRLRSNDQRTFFESISKNDLRCEYRYCSLVLPPTKLVLQKWKEG